jgi:hypothetical protein
MPTSELRFKQMLDRQSILPCGPTLGKCCSFAGSLMQGFIAVDNLVNQACSPEITWQVPESRAYWCANVVTTLISPA